MTLPDSDTLGTYGGATTDAAPVVNPLTDRPASAVNQAYGSTAMMTRTAIKAWARFTTNNQSTATILSHEEQWAQLMPGTSGPVITGAGSAGLLTITYPTTVFDEIPQGSPGSNPGHSLQLRAAWANVEITTGTFLQATAKVTAANVVTVSVWSIVSGAFILTDTVGLNVAVYAV